MTTKNSEKISDKTVPSSGSSWKGVVVSARKDKTLLVRVDQYRTHSKYLKKYRLTRKYLVHDESTSSNVGDVVVFEVCRPISKRKCYRVVGV